MASRKSSKKSVTQQAIGLATMGMPAPVQQVATSRWGSRLLLLLVPILLATGVLSIRWVNGLPSFSFNADRAAVVGQKVELEARRAAAQLAAQGGVPQAATSQPAYQQPPQQLYQPAYPQQPTYPQQTAQPYYPAYR
ncbi:MAG: hypothetical protein EBR86_02375 [Planctomycetia bacterium]|nr:hypothetical protein [Planctomycetia bacterium]